MDTNKNLQQTNTFVRGMNTDTSDALLNSDQYRYAENVRLTTDDLSNTGELHMIEGNKGIHTFNEDVLILGTTSIRDYGVMVVRNNEPEEYRINVYVSRLYNQKIHVQWDNTKNPPQEDIITISFAMYADNDYIDFARNIECANFTNGWLDLDDYRVGWSDITQIDRNNTTVETNARNKKYIIYFYLVEDLNTEPWLYVDGYPINISQTDPTEGYIKTWEVYRFKEPDVVEKFFGPCEEKIWNGEDDNISLLTRYESEDNIKLYIADGIHTLMQLNIGGTAPDPVPTSIESIAGKAIPIAPPTIQYGQNTGRIKAIKVQYYYILYDDSGRSSNLSPSSNILSLYKNSKNGYAPNSYASNSIDITIPAVSNTSFNKIRIYRVAYILNSLQPEIALIADQKHNTTTYIDDGNRDIEKISVSDFLSLVNFNIIPKQIESKNDYLFAADVKYKTDNTDELFKDVDVTTLTNQQSDSFGEGEYFQWHIYASLDYKYVTLNTNNASYNYNIKDYCGYRPGEIYRFGVILYDMYGNASSVKYMLDIEIPYSKYSVSVAFDPNTGDGGVPYGLSNITMCIPVIKFKLRKQIPNCSRYEIVRCIRRLQDKKTITLGIVGNVFYELDNNNVRTNKTCPTGFMSLGSISGYAYDYNKSVYAPCTRTSSDSVEADVGDLFCFSSPEYTYQSDDMLNIINDNIELLYMRSIYSYYPNIQFLNSAWEPLNSGEDPYAARFIDNYTIYSVIMGCAGMQHLTYYKTIGDRMHNTGISFDRNDKHGSIHFSEIFPRFVTEVDNVSRYMFTEDAYIKNVAYPKVPQYNSFALGETIRFQDDVTQIGNYQFIGWSVPFSLSDSVSSESDLYKLWKDGYGVDNWLISSRGFYGLGTVGKSILFTTQQNMTVSVPGNLELSYPVPITIVDLRKKCIPYGGTSDSALKNSVYYSFGDIFDNDTNPHVVDSGDCYAGLFRYVSLHNWYDTTFVTPAKMGIVYIVPVLSDTDPRGQYGHIYDAFDGRNKNWYIQDTPAQFDDYIQTNSLYLYNTAYNQDPDLIPLTPSSENNKRSEFDTRVHYSYLKINGEVLDSWLRFKSNDFLDVDSRYGRITGLKLFKDKLVFWQNNAVGLLSVNERVVLQDASNSLVVLGTGSTLERYDYFSTVYGMKENLHSFVCSDSALYWWDGYRKEILQYVDKYSINQLSTIKYIKNYINSKNESTNPSLVYDTKYKEVICNCVGDESIVYSEQIQAFSSIYKFAPAFSFNIFQNLYTFNNNRMFLLNTAEQTAGESKLFGEDIYPMLKYIVNLNNTYVKTFDIQTFGGNFYGGGVERNCNTDNIYKTLNLTYKYYSSYEQNEPLSNLQLTYKTPLNQIGKIENGFGITNREYDYRLNIPRQGKNVVEDGNTKWVTENYGDRLRGKTLQCEFKSSSNSTDFSLLYITTKYRISWS